jgi:plastocyanin
MQKFILALLPALAAAQTIRIDVGLNGLAFTPNNVTAGVGTTLEFVYHPKKHSVSQSSFTAPCVPLEGGFNSGFVPVTSGEGVSQDLKA